MDITKVTVNLPTETLDALRRMAGKRRTTVTEALRQIIESQGFLDNEIDAGNKLLLQDPDKGLRQVIFNPRVSR